MYQDIPDGRTVRELRPRGRRLLTKVVPGFGQGCSIMRVPLRSKIIMGSPASMMQTLCPSLARSIPKRMPRNSTAPVFPTIFNRISSERSGSGACGVTRQGRP